MNKIRKLFGRKVGKSKFALPLWTVGLAAMAIAAVAGQAVGPVLSGSVSGSVGVVVEQTVRLGDPGDIGDVSGLYGPGAEFGGPEVNPDADDFAATVNDEGTGFTVAVETDMGQETAVGFDLYNDSGQTANAMLQLNVPAGIDVELNGNDGVTEAQLGPNTWLLTIPDDTAHPAPDGFMDLIISSKDNAAPGFYTITGTLVQISG